MNAGRSIFIGVLRVRDVAIAAARGKGGGSGRLLIGVAPRATAAPGAVREAFECIGHQPLGEPCDKCPDEKLEEIRAAREPEDIRQLPERIARLVRLALRGVGDRLGRSEEEVADSVQKPRSGGRELGPGGFSLAPLPLGLRSQRLRVLRFRLSLRLGLAAAGRASRPHGSRSCPSEAG